MPIVTVILSLPQMITPEEHTELIASTPSSFANIPPILRHREQNIRLTFDPPITDFSEVELSSGTLYVVESAFMFMSAASGKGFEIKYPNIILHGISRPETGPYVYCQLGEASSGDNDADEGNTDTEFQELQIFPDDTSTLDQLFQAISECGSLHPDPQSEGSDIGLDDDDAFVDPEIEAAQQIDGEEFELTEAGRATLAHLEALLDTSSVTGLNGTNEQFADAESPEPESR